MKILCISYLVILFILSLGASVIQKIRHNKKYKTPFCEPRLRPAGESLRLQLEKLDEKWETLLYFFACSITSPLVLFVYLPPKWWDLASAGVIAWILLVICSIVTVFISIKLLRHEHNRWNISLGFEGERFVGQILTNELVPLGCRVFHDIPFDGFNIDHVVVAPTGVFAIETKTRRKPIGKKKGRHEYEITYDGERLIFPVGMKPHDALEQTQRNARTLAKELCGALGRPISVKPVLVYPGWMVKTSKRGPVSVINPHMLKHVVFPNYNRSGDNDTPFDEELLNRISAQLTKLDTLDGK